MNVKITSIVKLEIRREELRWEMAEVTYLENKLRMLERNNEVLASSNGFLIAYNTLFHDKIR
jgi:hypothetical protein